MPDRIRMTGRGLPVQSQSSKFKARCSRKVGPSRIRLRRNTPGPSLGRGVGGAAGRGGLAGVPTDPARLVPGRHGAEGGAVGGRGQRGRELELRPKGDPFKVRLARRLREQTTVTVAWIAGRLRMGTRGHVTHLLYWHERKRPKVR
jgi:hypothetical protein